MEFDAAYDNAGHVASSATYPPKWAAAAAAFRDALGARARLDLPWGAGERHGFDLFGPESGQAKGLLVFVHGGYWRRFDRSFWSHLAAGPLAHGWAVAMPSYDLCPTVRVSDITAQMVRAVTAAAAEVAGPIRLAGHSAGGHLVARLGVPRMLPEAVAARLARIVPISPVADLRPLLRTSMNDDLQLDAAEAEAESPVLQPRPVAPVTVWVGAAELPAFVDQAGWLGTAWGAEVVRSPGEHHFSVVEPLADPESALTRACLA
jgi:arylformamidase